jgi:hypothetical protein
MNTRPPTSGNLPDEDPRLGEPITALSQLEQNTSPGFFGIVRKKILGRMAASQVASFSWQLPRIIAIELITMLVDILSGFAGPRKGEKS